MNKKYEMHITEKLDSERNHNLCIASDLKMQIEINR